jgi:TPR repeat protein
MARFEMLDIEGGGSGQGAPAIGSLTLASLQHEPVAQHATGTADAFYALGMMYCVGESVAVDLVSAHKWFNLAAMRGNQDAVRLRREIAQEMSEGEIAQAQRAARAWLKAN